jgi:hypothetical protein
MAYIPPPKLSNWHSMSLLTVKKAVIWLNQEHKTEISMNPESINDIPTTWLDLQSSTFSDKSDGSVEIHRNTGRQPQDVTTSKSAKRVRTIQSVPVEKEKLNIEGRRRKDSRSSITAQRDSSIVYAGKLGLSLIFLSLCLSTFVVGLDIAILTTAM